MGTLGADRDAEAAWTSRFGQFGPNFLELLAWIGIAEAA